PLPVGEDLAIIEGHPRGRIGRLAPRRAVPERRHEPVARAMRRGECLATLIGHALRRQRPAVVAAASQQVDLIAAVLALFGQPDPVSGWTAMAWMLRCP